MLSKLKRMKNSIISIFLGLIFLISKSVVAQSEMELFKSKGEIPDVFLENSFSKIEKDIKVQKEKNSKNYRKYKEKKFIKRTHFQLDNLLKSGSVIFGTDENDFINNIARDIIESNSQFQLDHLEFYILKSSEVNAFSTHQGLIFLTTGLLAKVKSESEISFVLCHEISHNLLNHSIEKYDEIEKELKRIKDKNYFIEKRFVNKISEYSIGNEYSADSLGFSLYKNTRYKIEGAKEALVTLSHSNLSYLDFDVDSTCFNSREYNFPKSLFKVEKEAELKESGEVSEQLSILQKSLKKYKGTVEAESKGEKPKLKIKTHPKIEHRIFSVNSKIRQTKIEHKNSKIRNVSNSDFEEFQKQIRFNFVYQLMIETNYVSTVYESFVYEKKYGLDDKIKEYRAKSLYALSKYRLLDDWTVDLSINLINENKHVSHYKERKEVYKHDYEYDKPMVSLAKGKAKIEEGTSKLYNVLVENCKTLDLAVLTINQMMSLDTPVFDNYVLDLLKDIKFLMGINIMYQSKESAIDMVSRDSLSNYVSDGFVNFIELPRFKRLLKLVDSEVKDDLMEKSNLDINKVSILSPFDIHIKNFKLKEEKSLLHNEMLKQTLSASFKNVGIKNTMYDYSFYDRNDVEKINQNRILNSWIKGFYDFQELGIIPLIDNEMEELIENNDLRYIVTSNNISLKYPYFSNEHRYGIVASLIFAINSFPYFATKWFGKNNLNRFTINVFDLENKTIIHRGAYNTKYNVQEIQFKAQVSKACENIKKL